MTHDIVDLAELSPGRWVFLDQPQASAYYRVLFAAHELELNIGHRCATFELVSGGVPRELRDLTRRSRDPR